MANMTAKFFIPIAVFSVVGTSHGATVETVYTATNGKACVVISTNRETGDTVRRCPGIAGLAILVLESDARASISIVKKKSVTLPLDFWSVVTPTFSTLGPRIEWKVKSKGGKQTPVALIVRVNTVDQTDVAAPKPVSFLAVVQLRDGAACVTAKIPANHKHANEQARAAAIAPASQCLPKIGLQ